MDDVATLARAWELPCGHRLASVAKLTRQIAFNLTPASEDQNIFHIRSIAWHSSRTGFIPRMTDGRVAGFGKIRLTRDTGISINTVKLLDEGIFSFIGKRIGPTGLSSR